ncbi:mechanosensitive ion channel family protein [Hyperthermus butylicus]|uniref:Mechanosensitive ion channel, M-S channel n=1 Tax=Hyperthermus butylicus (strain DSM 5456 / JCM 9403 / PLM1-5) TaxID=415426 RepID=A2BJR1_HYPBU|nr:mechanosensitive ion channel family protein [Hyperthermus butylicus]ABM80222.1 Mechanosensitive ion channel, M-S channel [Hyperthermus butylicus DSM 5456]
MAAESLAALLETVGSYIYKIVVFSVVMVAGIAVSMLIRRMIRRTLEFSQFPHTVVDIASKMVYYLLVALAGVIALGVAGFDVTGFAFAGSLIGVALGFASQTVASNFFSGLFLYFDKPLKPGDMVELPDLGIMGVVEDITLFSTRITTLDGLKVRIPNESIFRSVIKNLYSHQARRVEYLVGISYSSDIDVARETIFRILEDHPWVLAEPKPVVYVEELGDSAVVLRVIFWTPSTKWLRVRWELLEKIKKALDEAGVEIPFPQRVVWLRLPEAGAASLGVSGRIGGEGLLAETGEGA